VRVELPYKWKPRPYQQDAWDYLSGGGKRAVLKWHRRSGKDDLFLHHTACAAFERPGNYWYMLPEYSQARKSMWDAVNAHTGKRRIDEAFPQEIRKYTREHEMMIGLGDTSTFQLVGSDNFNSLVGSPPVGLVFSEYALSDPSAWGYLMPIVEENGGWVGFNSTPRGNNHFKNLCRFAESEPGWFYQSLTADKTGVYTEVQLQAILRELQSTHGEDFGKALWLQEYFCSFDAAIPGSIWGDCITKAEAESRIGRVDHTPGFPVSTAWDLGRTDDTAIWFFQMVAGDINIIDYHASSLKEIPFYAQLLRDRAKERGFVYGTHWIPHDARPRRLGMGGKSILQQLVEEQVGRFVITPRLDVQEGIQAARKTFPLCHFDRERCDSGLEALKQYHREWNDEKKCFEDAPYHDWSSHASDAFRYLSLVWKHPKTREPSTTLREKLFAGNITGQSFGELKKQHFRRMRERRQQTIH
jgi:phage terminase large subunit